MQKRQNSFISLVLLFSILFTTCVKADYVHIEKYTDDVQTGEYTGDASLYPEFDASALTEYDNNIVVDWDSDNVYYVTPAEEPESNTYSLTNTSENDCIYTAFFDNFGYVESFSEKSEYIGFEAVHSGGDNITSVLAVYAPDNSLYRVKKAEGENGAVVYTESLPDNCTIKAMVWDEAMEKPLTDAVNISFTITDSYPDSVNNAYKLSDINRIISGSINNTNDTDCFSFSPEVAAGII